MARKLTRADLPPGTIVKWSTAFLRSTGQYTRPLRAIDGLVVEGPDTGPWVMVHWNHLDGPVLVHPGNLHIVGSGLDLSVLP